MRPENPQPSPRSIIRSIVENQPEDASYDEIMRELLDRVSRTTQHTRSSA